MTSVRALLPRFTGRIEQVPPRFSAVKIEGERAYDLAREGEEVELAARPVDIHRLEWVSAPDPDRTVLVAECGKGTYIRALARDMGRVLGCFGHVEALRRIAVGPFDETNAISLEALEGRVRQSIEQSPQDASSVLQPVAAGVAALPSLNVGPADAGRLARGQTVLLRGRDAPIVTGLVAVFAQGALVALAEVDRGEVWPRRIFNLPRPGRDLVQ